MKLLFVCNGNNSRSPMAEELARRRFTDVEVFSRGINAADGKPVCQNTIDALGETGINATGKLRHKLTFDDLSADLIVAMDFDVRDALVDLGVDPAHLTVIDGGIADPRGKDIDAYRECRRSIEEALDKLVAKL